MKPEIQLELIAKSEFINRVSNAISGQHRIAITEIRLDVFEHAEYGIAEYIVITYLGGAIAVRNANGNSNSANFREIGSMIDGGYYDEVALYRRICSSNDWIKVDLSEKEVK